MGMESQINHLVETNRQTKNNIYSNKMKKINFLINRSDIPQNYSPNKNSSKNQKKGNSKSKYNISCVDKAGDNDGHIASNKLEKIAKYNPYDYFQQKQIKFSEKLLEKNNSSSQKQGAQQHMQNYVNIGSKIKLNGLGEQIRGRNSLEDIVKPDNKSQVIDANKNLSKADFDNQNSKIDQPVISSINLQFNNECETNHESINSNNFNKLDMQYYMPSNMTNGDYAQLSKRFKKNVDINNNKSCGSTQRSLEMIMQKKQQKLNKININKIVEKDQPFPYTNKNETELNNHSKDVFTKSEPTTPKKGMLFESLLQNQDNNRCSGLDSPNKKYQGLGSNSPRKNNQQVKEKGANRCEILKKLKNTLGSMASFPYIQDMGANPSLDQFNLYKGNFFDGGVSNQPYTQVAQAMENQNQKNTRENFPSWSVLFKYNPVLYENTLNVKSNNYQHCSVVGLESNPKLSPMVPKNLNTGLVSHQDNHLLSNNDSTRKIPSPSFANMYYMNKLYKYWKNCENNYFSRSYCDHFQMTFNHLQMLSNDKIHNNQLKKVKFLGDENSKEPKDQLQKLSLSKKRKKILVLDMDETLIHCKSPDEYFGTSSRSYDRTITIKLNGGGKAKGYIYFRPHVFKFLRTMSLHYEIVIWTASNQNYALPVIALLDPERKYIKAKYFRENCLSSDFKYYIKDLRMLEERDLSEIVIVDNTASCFYNNLDNAIPIIPFIDNVDDSELLDLQNFLVWLSDKSDVRTEQRNVFGFWKYLGCENIKEVFAKVFENYSD